MCGVEKMQSLAVQNACHDTIVLVTRCLLVFVSVAAAGILPSQPPVHASGGMPQTENASDGEN